jgi:hypothetical protein
MDGLVGIVTVIVVGVVAGGAVVLMKNRSDTLLAQWAEKQHYRILEASFRPIVAKGPFWYASRGQTVFRIIVEDEFGQVRKGWVRLGHWLGGLASEEITVKWDAQTG